MELSIVYFYGCFSYPNAGLKKERPNNKIWQTISIELVSLQNYDNIGFSI